MRYDVEILTEKIMAARTILIMGHKNVDGDVAGSVLGMRHLIMENFGKVADMAYDGNMPIYFDFLPGRDDFIFAEKIAGRKYDLVISVDSGSRVQFGDHLWGLFSAASDTIKIDHHVTEDFSAALDIVNTLATSACEVVFDIADAANWRIGPDAATCLYSGIYTDTGNFSWVDSGEVFRKAGALVDFGAHPREVRNGMDIATKNDIMAQAQVLASAEFFYGGRLAVALIPHSLYKRLDSGGTEIVLFLRRIKDIEFVAILKEAREKEINVSLRSRGIPVRPIAEKLGAGGHDLAAGAKLFVGLNEAKKIIVEAFAGM